MVIKKIYILFNNFFKFKIFCFLALCYAQVSLASTVITSSNFSAFNELLVVQPTARIQLQFPYSNINTDYVTATTASGGTVTAGPAASANANLVSLTTTVTSGSSAILSSNRRLHYHPGQGSVCEFTAIYGTGIVNNNQLVGIGNAQDGFFFGYNGLAFGILQRSSSSGSLVDTWTAQTAWNVDKMDGTGTSGITLNPQTGNIYKIQFQWLGFGVINFFITNPNDGTLILVHRILWPNAHTTSSTLNGSMQLYAQNINTSISTGTTLKICSMAAFVEGVLSPIENVRNAFVTTTGRAAPAASITNILAIQNKTTFNGVTNQVPIFLNAISLVATATANARIDLYLNPTLSGALTFTDINASTSVVAQSTTSVTVTSGKLLISFYVDATSSVIFDLESYNIFLNPGDVLVIAGQGIGGSASTFASVTWNERF